MFASMTVVALDSKRLRITNRVSLETIRINHLKNNLKDQKE